MFPVSARSQVVLALWRDDPARVVDKGARPRPFNTPKYHSPSNAMNKILEMGLNEFLHWVLIR